MTNFLSVPLPESYHNCFQKKNNQNLNIIMFETWQGINSMGLSASLEEYKNKQLFTNMKMSQTALI